jgi:hypothetical protein
MRLEREKVTASFTGAFGGLGIVLLLTVHGLWYESVRSMASDLPSPATLMFEPTVINCLAVSFLPATLAFFTAFVGTREAFRISSTNEKRRGRVCTILPLVTFLVVVLGAVIGCYFLPFALNWVEFLGAFILAGITGISQSMTAQSLELEDTVKVATTKTRPSPDGRATLCKWLELEHADCQSSLQWIVWASIIFATAGLVTWYTRPAADSSPLLFSASVFRAVVVAVWAIVGLFFGIMAPFFRSMSLIKKTLRELAYDEDHPQTIDRSIDHLDK